MPYLELSDEKHHKFYEISQVETVITLSYGRIGREGRSKTKNFPTISEASMFLEKMIKQKEKRGYKISLKGLTPPRTRNTNANQLKIPFLEER